METKELFANPAQSNSEDRAAVNNLTDANMNLTTKVAKQANQMATKDAAIAMM